MLKELGGLMSMLKNANEIPAKMQAMADELKNKRVEGAAGGGLVTIEVNGLGQVLKCRIDPGLMTGGDRELIEDLVAAAVNQAQDKARLLHAEAMKSVTGGMNLPGLEANLSKMMGGMSPDGTDA